MNLLMLGPPGSGKGSQSLLLSKEYGLAIISTGDLLRSISLDSLNPLSAKINDIMSSGGLLDDNLMCQIFYERLKMEKRGVILDGFPRNLFQANFLDKVLGEMGKVLDAVVELDVKFEAVVARIKGRIVCKNCGFIDNLVFLTSINGNNERLCNSCGSNKLLRRSDDVNSEVIEKRFSQYHSDISHLKDFYKNIIFIVEAESDILKVNSIIKNKLDRLIIG